MKYLSSHIMISVRSSVWDYFFYRPSRTWLFQPDEHSREITVRTKDDKQLVCLFVQTRQRQKIGSVFILHGRGGNASVYAPYLKPLAEGGFDLFIVDWRGYGKSTGHPHHLNVIEDSSEALNYFLSLETVQPYKKILFGLSIGGHVAIHLAKKFPGSFDALVTEGAIASFDMAVKDYYPGFWGWFFQWFISLPYSAREDIRATGSLPKLIIHSADDRKILFKHAELLYDNAPEPKTLLRIGGQHLCGMNPPQTTIYLDAIKKLINHLTILSGSLDNK
jgi:pimeloyl-ACP methyl ester carboxylesterase